MLKAKHCPLAGCRKSAFSQIAQPITKAVLTKNLNSMDDTTIKDTPRLYPRILAKSEEIGFTMPSDIYIGTFLKTLISSKPGGHFLELGTGIGLSLAWMVDGLQGAASLITVDNDPELSAFAEELFNQDGRVSIVCQDGTAWINGYAGPDFDLVFADAWPGKYSETKEILSKIKIGGFYVIDDMTAQPNWPAGHEDNVSWLVNHLENRDDFVLTKMGWSTGLMVVVRVV
ncbi:MAG: putative O-methyltransferase YrrM [Neolewinella sp.]|jgi:predicted O-methyltransferase YrrM